MGVVLEAKLDGARATVLVQNGTLHNGDNLSISDVYGKIHAMFDDARNYDEEEPSLGLEGLPQAGNQLVTSASGQGEGDNWIHKARGR